jgi:tetratricopeptide (TPR) repeat protein
MKEIRGYGLILIIVLALFLAGCSVKQAPQFLPGDNPDHHYLQGMEALESGNIADAQKKFERAVFINEYYALGYAGLAVVAAAKGKEQIDKGLKTAEAQQATAHLKRAGKLAQTPEEKFGCDISALRVSTLLKEKGWLNKSEEFYRDAMSRKVKEPQLLYYEGKEAASYFVGVTFLEAREFQKARNHFGEVLNAKHEGKWNEPADRAWKKTDKIVRAMTGMTVGEVAKKIALQDAVSRADMAVLLIDELKIDKLMDKRFPITSEKKEHAVEYIPADIQQDPFRQEIITLMEWNVRGMEPKYDDISKAYLFMPADNVQRGEMALIIEDVLIKLIGDDKLASAYFNHEKSPFPDVRPTSPFYNAVMNVTTRGIMMGESSGEFHVNKPVDGADALLAIRMLKQHVNIH